MINFKRLFGPRWRVGGCDVVSSHHSITRRHIVHPVIVVITPNTGMNLPPKSIILINLHNSMPPCLGLRAGRILIGGNVSIFFSPGLQLFGQVGNSFSFLIISQECWNVNAILRWDCWVSFIQWLMQWLINDLLNKIEEVVSNRQELILIGH